MSPSSIIQSSSPTMTSEVGSAMRWPSLQGWTISIPSMSDPPRSKSKPWMAWASHRLQHGPGHCALRRHVHELSLARLQHPGVRGQRAHGRLRPCVTPCLRHADPDRRSIPRALQEHGSAQRGDHQVVAQILGAGPVDAEGRNADVDDARMDLPDGGRVEAELAKRARRARLEDEVRRPDQGPQQLPVGRRVLRIEHDRTLVAIEGAKREARQVAVRTRDPGLRPPRRGTAGRLDPNHVGPEVPQHHRSDLAALVREVEHPVRLQHRHRLGPLAARPLSRAALPAFPSPSRRSATGLRGRRPGARPTPPLRARRRSSRTPPSRGIP